MKGFRKRLSPYLRLSGLAALCCLASGTLYGQVKNIGIPHIINYPKSVYQAASQSWSISQDPRGILYFGNNDGVLEFDGKRWNLYSIPDRFLYRAILAAGDGTIYVGLTGDFGKLVPDSHGRFTYQSISAGFPQMATGFNDIWKIFETRDGIWFQAKNKIFRYSGGSLEVILPDREFNFLHKVNNTLYTSERHIGLQMISGSQAVRVPGGEVFIGKNIEAVIPFDESRIIIGTAKNGLWLYDGTRAVPWATGASGFLSANSIFCGTQVSKRHFAFGTIRSGVLIIDRDGRPVQHINQDKGLQNNTVLTMFTDRENNLWLGLDQGISYIELNSPITYYSYGNSLPGTGYCSLSAEGFLYAGTNQGLFYKRWSDYDNPLAGEDQFSLVQGTQGQVWSLKYIDETLFCGHNLGTFGIKGGTAATISENPGGWDFQTIPALPGIILEGTYSGFDLLEQSGGGWKPAGSLSGFNESSRNYTLEEDGSLWVAHGSLGIFRVVPDAGFSRATRVRAYNESDGLPSRYRNSLCRIGKRILFTTLKGIYLYNPASDTFEPDPDFSKLLGQEPVSALFEDPDGNIWYFKPGELGVIRSGGGGAMTVEKRPFSPVRKMINRGWENVFVADERNIFIACEQGFAHYDPAFPARYPESAGCFIRSVTGTGDSTRLFFGGLFKDPQGEALYLQPKGEAIRIPFAYHDIRLEYAVPLFDNPEDILFSCMLEGYDASMSEWSPEASKDYTGVREGIYTFRVRGRNIYNVETSIAEIRIRVLPPWYRSVVAYIVYLLILAAGIRAGVRLVISRIRKDKRMITLRHERDINQARQQHLAESLEAEKRMVMLEKEKLESEMSHKNKQLASSISGLLRKNEFLIHLRDEMARITGKTGTPQAEEKLKRLMASVEENLETDNEYEQFEDHFDAVHDDFLKNLKKEFPQLTPKDLRLCAYLRMNLSTKEIAPLLNISPRGVEISRYRLRKKMNLPHDANLIDFMLRF